MESQGKDSTKICRTCGEDPACCKLPKFCSQCGAKDPLESQTVLRVASDRNSPSRNENGEETGARKEPDGRGSSNAVNYPLQETVSTAALQVTSDGDVARANNTGDKAARQEGAVNLGSPSVVNFPSQESGAVAVKNVSEDKWLEGINDRFGLLVYGKSDFQHERRIFQKDCEDLSNVLLLNQYDKEKSQDNMVISQVNWETRFLKLVIIREQQITDGLLSYLETVFPRWSDSKETEKLIQDLCTRIRLLKAMDKVRTLWENNNGRIEGAETGDYLQVLEVVLEERWKRVDDESDPLKRASILISHRQLTDRALDNKRNYSLTGYSKKLEECDMMKNFLCESKKLEECDMMKNFLCESKKFEVLSLSDEIFSKSLYLSGFPNHKKAFKELSEFMPFFSSTIEIIKSLESMSNEAYMRDSKSHATHPMIEKKNAEDIFHELILLLAEWQTHSRVPDQWIWIHYSGHGKGYLQLEEPLQNMHDMINLTCEIFSDVVVTLDCCFPNVSSYIPHPRLRLMLSNEKYFEALMRESSVCSIFTKLLTFALHGFPSERCCSTMKLVFPEVGVCTCETCIAYRGQLKPRIITMKIGDKTQYQICNYCEKLMEKCVIENFIFPHHIDQFFKEHFCKKIPQPVITFQCHMSENEQRPLTRAVRKAIGKEM